MPPAADTAVTAPVLRRALIAGAQRVIAARDLLNRINVFPVADGDTGSNLAATLGGLLHGALRRRGGHVGELLQHVADDAIDGARGNSGAILAQFLHGVAEHARSHRVLEPAALAAAVGHGARQARGALSDPVEGTILSVIDRFAAALAEAAGTPGADPRQVFAHALDEARSALARTPQQLALLRTAGVVDAGAHGFVDLLEGIADALDHGPRARHLHLPLAGADEAAGINAAIHAPHAAVDPQRRWCTECLLLGADIDGGVLRTRLAGLGADSVVLAGGATRLRVHAHVGVPQALFDACAGFGAVEAMKADDMLLQARSLGSPQRVAIVTDSAADLPAAIAARHVLHVVPVRVTVDGRDYLDKVGLTTADFYRRMAAADDLPRTSQPPPGDFRRVFEFLRAHHAEVVYVGLSRAVSGTLQSAEHAAARLDGGVHVFDSVNAAGGQALLAWRAAELAAAGAEAAVILRELERLRPQTLTWAMARDIRHAVRGGRIPAWAAPAVRLSGLTPVARMRADGRLGLAGGLFARARAPEAFAHYVATRVRKAAPRQATRWRAIVGHCDAARDARHCLERLRQRLHLSDAHLVDTGPALGAHGGQGTLVVALQPAPQADTHCTAATLGSRR